MHALSKHKHFWAYRNGQGMFKKQPSILPTLILIPAIIFIVRLGFSLPAVPSASTMNVNNAEAVKTVDGVECDKVCDLTDEATKKKAEGVTFRSATEWTKWKRGPMGILEDVCASKNVKDGKCPAILAAMARTESVFGKKMVGDSGKSAGYFHINATWHNVPKSCSYDLACSATWTLNRMIAKGYRKDWETAVMLHNGTPGTKKTLAYLASVKGYMRTFVPTLAVK